jgi:hypothetical protein
MIRVISKRNKYSAEEMNRYQEGKHQSLISIQKNISIVQINYLYVHELIVLQYLASITFLLNKKPLWISCKYFFL